MLNMLAVAAGVGVVAGGLTGWKVAGAWWASRVKNAQADKAEVERLLGEARKERDAFGEQLARERRFWSAEEERRDALEKRMRADLELTRKERDDALRADPARAGDHLDSVLSGGAPRPARGNQPAPGDVRGPAAPARAAPRQDDETR